MVTVDSGKIEASNKFREVPKSKWKSLVRVKRDFLSVRINYDCRCLIEFCEEAKEVYAELGYASSEQMIREGYELDPSQIELAVAWLNENKPDKPVGMGEIKEQIAEAKKDAETIKQGTRTDIEPLSNRKKLQGGGTGVAYTLRRLARDCPEMLDRIEAGELSVNAAAIQAGIRKKPTQEDICLRSFKKCSNHTEMLTRLREYYETFIASDSTKP